MLAIDDDQRTTHMQVLDQSIRNLVSIGTDAMDETDREVLKIMTHKTK